MKHPYAVPTNLSPCLARVQSYWRGLLRGAATMPFWNDAKLSDLPDLSPRLFLIDVFQRPERFRFGIVGEDLGSDLSGAFLDELRLGAPFSLLRSQCAASVEDEGPTFVRLAGDQAQGGARPYGRLVLPMWGDGRISMLLGAVELS